MTFHFSLKESDSEVAILVENSDKRKKWMVLAIPAKYAVNCEMETQIAFALIAAGKQLGFYVIPVNLTTFIYVSRSEIQHQNCTQLN
uniref:Uncharacterized protein n=1 Tax=Anguilla anguilla TaxID=7936 RepID=A0A0E9X5F1_ANGAN